MTAFRLGGVTEVPFEIRADRATLHRWGGQPDPGDLPPVLGDPVVPDDAGVFRFPVWHGQGAMVYAITWLGDLLQAWHGPTLIVAGEQVRVSANGKLHRTKGD